MKYITRILLLLIVAMIVLGAFLIGKKTGEGRHISAIVYAIANAATTGEARVGDLTLKRLPIQWGEDMVVISIWEMPINAKEAK